MFTQIKCKKVNLFDLSYLPQQQFLFSFSLTWCTKLTKMNKSYVDVKKQ